MSSCSRESGTRSGLRRVETDGADTSFRPRIEAKDRSAILLLQSSCIMFYYSKPLLLVILIVLLNGHSWAKEVVGIIGNGITIDFSFHNMSKPSAYSIGLYKDSKKISECNHSVHNCCSQSQSCIFENKKASFCIRNLTSVDNGTYWITLFQTNRDPPMLKSNKVSLILQSDGNTTEWDQQEDVKAKQQGSGEASTSMSVYAVEYGVLDFNSRPSGGEGNRHGREREREGGVVRPAETVEYASITFPPQQRVSDGRQ
ncbi:unnamed protein product [Coregonus sp. 'balchen']|nr:unnamed protein product [Coregonus sp. 'balchen']